jgi:hypothetical protein
MSRVFIVISIFVTLVSYGQSRKIIIDELKNNRYKLIEEVPGQSEIYKITNLITNKTVYKNLGGYKTKTKINKTTFLIDTTVINPDLVDTSRFNGMYEYWTTVPIGSFGPEVIIAGDVNKNGNTELYGARYNSYTKVNERSMYEYNPNLQLFEFKTDMPWDSITDYSSFKQIYDINMDGEENVFITGSYQTIDSIPGINVARTFRLNDSTNLPTDIVFDYKQCNQMNDPIWGEYDNREGTDLFYCGESCDLRVAAARYDKTKNKAETVFVYLVPDSIFYLAGTSNGDIDNDGFPEFGTGGLRGDIVVFEYQEDFKNYKDVWYGDAGTFNVYIHFYTNDIDGNGKKELWVGGDAFYGDIAKTRLTCLEAIGNNHYEAKHVIDIVNRASFDAYNGFAVDIDKDGTEEIGLCLDMTFMILKFNGNVNKWGFDPFYLKLNDFEQSQGIYFGALMYDANNDGFEELFIMSNRVFNNYQSHVLLTNIYQPTDLVGIKEPELNITSYSLYQNYPNPFNPTTSVEYIIEKKSYVKIEVFNMLGERIEELANKEQVKGKYNITFNGSNLPSGVYFIKMTAEDLTRSANCYSKTIKALLVK